MERVRATVFTSDALFLRALVRRQVRYRRLTGPAGEAESQASAEVGWLLQSLGFGSGSGTGTRVTETSTALSRDARRRLLRMAVSMTRGDKPLGYAIGSVPFAGLPDEIKVEPPVLIPRPETEHWVAELVRSLPRDRRLRILDACTGSGCIGLALAHALPNATVTAIDVSDAALDLARRNARHLALPLDVRRADLFSDTQLAALTLNGNSPFDLVVSNPPYIPASYWHALDASVREWEDPAALVAGKDGLRFYRRLAQLAARPAFLRQGRDAISTSTPRMVLEFGAGQDAAVSRILHAHAAPVSLESVRPLVVGLGNYTPPSTRHSIAQLLLASLSPHTTKSRQGWHAELPLALPATPTTPPLTLTLDLYTPRYLMNLSGRGVAAVLGARSPSDLLLIHDELERPFGKVAPKNGGSAAGHNGVKSVQASLKHSADIARIRVGIDRPPPGASVAAYVLQKLPPDQLQACSPTGPVTALTRNAISAWAAQRATEHYAKSPDKVVEIRKDQFGVPRTAYLY